MSGPVITYPAGPMVPHGIYHLLKGSRPEVSLQSWNDTVCFYLMGGRSEVDRTTPESVQLVDIKGLIAPWDTIDQQGATEDGTTFIDALYRPIEVDAKVVVRGRDAQHTRRVQRHLFESIDVKQRSELGWMTQELGYWWAPVRWKEAPPDGYSGKPDRQQWTLVLRADSGFWQSYPDVASFGLDYEDMVEQFSGYEPTSLGSAWPQYYSGSGGGFMYKDRSRAIWKDDGPFVTDNREVVNGPYVGFSTVTDNQVVSMTLGSREEWSTKSGANDVWARMGRDGDGDWDGTGIRLRVTIGRIELSSWIGFVKQWERIKKFSLGKMIPHNGDVFTLVAGYNSSARLFRVRRNGGEIFAFQETGTISRVGSSYRGVGFGVRAGGALITQATPATVTKIAAGDNSEVTRYGHLDRRNAGDQDAYDAYTLYGPGTFGIGNGPGSTDYVTYGPLSVGEIVHIRTDPRKRGIFDLTNVTPDDQVYLFGSPPSDELYKKLSGRFFQNQIPAKRPGERVQTHQIAVSLTGGNADSQIVASLTPLRRYPE